jgi:arsenate reductase
MTCDHADQNCPVIPHAVKRIPLTYIDPKASDGTETETETYLKTSEKIATEMKFLFSQ